MTLISHRYNFIYIKNKKVASTSVEAFFEKYCVDPKKAVNSRIIQLKTTKVSSVIMWDASYRQHSRNGRVGRTSKCLETLKDHIRGEKI